MPKTGTATGIFIAAATRYGKTGNTLNTTAVQAAAIWQAAIT